MKSLGITEPIIVQWVIIAFVTVVMFFATRNLKKVPNKKQSALEIFVNAVNNIVKENMGESYLGFVPFIGSLAIFLLFMNLTGVIGVKPPTTDYSVACALAVMSFVIIQVYAIKKIGLGHYFLGYAQPMAFMLPINIMERIMLPVSLSLRLFGNMTAAAIIMDLIYSGLGKFAFGIPVPFHMYFDLFDGTIQMIVFVMLTMVNIKLISEH